MSWITKLSLDVDVGRMGCPLGNPIEHGGVVQLRRPRWGR